MPLLRCNYQLKMALCKSCASCKWTSKTLFKKCPSCPCDGINNFPDGLFLKLWIIKNALGIVKYAISKREYLNKLLLNYPISQQAKEVSKKVVEIESVLKKYIYFKKIFIVGLLFPAQIFLSLKQDSIPKKESYRFHTRKKRLTIIKRSLT